MTRDYSNERHDFGRAFELAYFIHANKEIAFFVAEDALDGLAWTICHQEKNRKPSERLQGFLKWGERSRPIRKTIRLNKQQTLQWLVYKQSEPWERATEQGEGLYLPSEEDMIVRYVEHMVFLAVRYGSFYVTLAVGSLLHQFNRRTTRMFYDILTQSDSARMKDTNYIGKQRLEMLEKVSRRFGQMIQTVKRPGEEKQFLMRETSRRVNDLVCESLRRFTPWGTTCVVVPRFDVTDIPGLYFSEGSADAEELTELNRIHTVLDPACFARFADGLSKYVHTLPDEDADKGCNYDLLEERLRVPRFSNVPSRTSRGDRFQAPELQREDYIRLERTLEARTHRRKNFIPRQICIYIDDVLLHSFEPGNTNRVRRLIGADAIVVEVRGRDEAGELTLAMLLRDYDHAGGASRGGTVIDPGGKKVTIRLTPVREVDGNLKAAWLEVSYTTPGLLACASRLARRAYPGIAGSEAGKSRGTSGFEWGRAWTIKAGLTATLVMAVSVLIWWQSQLRPTTHEVRLPEQVAWPQSEGQGSPESIIIPIPPSPPKPKPTPSPAHKEVLPVIARAAWSTAREDALQAVRLEPTRGEPRMIDTSRREAKIVVSLPLYDEAGHVYTHYRLTLSTAGSRLWQQTLPAPKVSLTGYEHILKLTLSARRLRGSGAHALEAEGRTNRSWRPVGKVALSPQER
jgi:hypothetical protein